VTAGIRVRAGTPRDFVAIESLYPAAFPAEDLVPLVRELLHASTSTLSLVASVDAGIVGHAAFTICSVEGTESSCALLGPLAVAPTCQGRGLGSAIVRTGLLRLEETGVGQVFVLGDPAYYRRFGFAPESGVEPPYALPAQWSEAWQSKRLRAGATQVRGKLVVPRPWRRAELWLP